MSESTLFFEGREIGFSEGMSVAAALIGAGVYSFRDTQATGSARGAYCMMGACYDCLIVIDGKPNCQACQVRAEASMRVSRQPAFHTPEVAES